ncbi:MAG: alpha/beta fold hydrolase [Ruminococcaceae bacterium]|nr:alpha/beta fold hydrolase [Oscillospiraceae bacterium]
MDVLCDTEYPIVLVHGVGFRDRKQLNYWGRIPDALVQHGAQVHYGNQDSHGSVESNALQLKNSIHKILDETGATKVNILAHSKGGLDARYMISVLDMAEKVASLTTLSTPHRGSVTVDRLLALPDFIVKVASVFINLWYRMLGDKLPDSYRLFHQLTTSFADRFNGVTPDSDKVYYQSYAFVMNTARSDAFMSLPYLVVKRLEGANDGLIAPASAEWGNFKGIVRSASKRGISHCDEVDMRRRCFTKVSKEGFVSDITFFYLSVVSDLRLRGL